MVNRAANSNTDIITYCITNHTRITPCQVNVFEAKTQSDGRGELHLVSNLPTSWEDSTILPNHNVDPDCFSHVADSEPRRTRERYKKRVLEMKKKIIPDRPCVVNVENSVTSARRDKIHCYFLGCLGEIGGPENRRKVFSPCNGTQQWLHVHSPKVGRHPPPQP